MANVQLESITKRFPDGTVAVDNVSLEVKDREFLVLIGPSGCGKSTTLRLIAGLEAGTSGEVRIGGRGVNHVAPNDRDIAMVFQDYALYPQMTVYKNLSFGLRLRNGGGVFARGLRKILRSLKPDNNLSEVEIDQQVRQTALRLGIESLLSRKPHQLSGGERQRVALGRAIVRNPAAFLFDEPLSNLDTQLRQKMRSEIKRLHRELNATMVYVTHDQVDAMTLGDRVAVMNDGKVVQVGKPLDVYQRPANLFAAKLLGNLPINLWRGTVKQIGDRVRLESRIRVELDSGFSEFDRLSQTLDSDGHPRDVIVGLRPEHVHVATEHGSVDAMVVDVDRLGDSTIIHAKICPKPNENMSIETETDEDVFLTRTSGETNLKSSDRVKLHVDPDRFMWFDPDTGENLLKE